MFLVRVFLLKINLRWVTEEWLIKVRTVISDYQQSFSNSLWEKMTNWWIEVFNYFTKKLIARDPRTKTGWSRPGQGPAKNLKPRTGPKPVQIFKSRTGPTKEIFANLGPIQTDWLEVPWIPVYRNVGRSNFSKKWRRRKCSKITSLSFWNNFWKLKARSCFCYKVRTIRVVK